MGSKMVPFLVRTSKTLKHPALHIISSGEVKLFKTNSAEIQATS
jgi:hypothetical protein